MPLSEVVDRVSILDIKQSRLDGSTKQAAARAWLQELRSDWAQASLPEFANIPEYETLCEINAELWDIEDALRAAEAAQCFDHTFVQNARAVYRLNDKRSKTKLAIDHGLQSFLTDAKQWHDG